MDCLHNWCIYTINSASQINQPFANVTATVLKHQPCFSCLNLFERALVVIHVLVVFYILTRPRREEDSGRVIMLWGAGLNPTLSDFVDAIAKVFQKENINSSDLASCILVLKKEVEEKVFASPHAWSRFKALDELWNEWRFWKEILDCLGRRNDRKAALIKEVKRVVDDGLSGLHLKIWLLDRDEEVENDLEEDWVFVSNETPGTE